MNRICKAREFDTFVRLGQDSLAIWLADCDFYGCFGDMIGQLSLGELSVGQMTLGDLT